MRFLGHDAPGVEWSEGPADTVPLNPPARTVSYPEQCPACGGGLGIDGYCMVCGQKAKSLREHYELTPAGWVAGICDIGLAHPRNEDALACQADASRAVLVVCDGVTTSEDADIASLAAARAACDRLWLDDPVGTGTATSRAAAIQAVLTQAVADANQAVLGTSADVPNSAATTIAMAVVDAASIHCANLGDSRVYWLPDGGVATQLTKDHSLAQDGIDAGTGRAEAESSVFAHTITRWLGRDATDLAPAAATQPRDAPGWLVVCSDGLWNYASEATAIGALVAGFAGTDPAPARVAASLVAWANEQGGHDNITVACARLADPAPGTAEAAPSSV